MNILVTGANGMLGSTFQKSQMLEQKWYIVYYADRDTLDITNSSQILSFLDTHCIDCVINCAAYTDVENAQDSGNTLNYEINTLSLANFSAILATRLIRFIHISTDYVFDGTQKEGYLTDDLVWPLNEYGKAKRLGEQILLRTCPNAKIVRTSWLYGGTREIENFVNTMLHCSETKIELSIINDQRGAPTHTSDLVQAIVCLVQERENHQQKIFHFCNKARAWWVTWFDFAQEIFALAKKTMKLNPIPSSQYPSKAPRPHHSRLINDSDIQLPDRKESLEKYLNERN